MTMTYCHILKATHRALLRAAAHSSSALRCGFVRVSVLSSSGRPLGAPVLLRGALSCLTQRTAALHCSACSRSGAGDRDKSVSRYQQSGAPRASTAQKVKEAGRDFTYLIVVLIGLGVTGGMLYVVFQELFSSSSPNKLYGKAFDKVRSHPEVIGAFGEPIKCYGNTTRRGRRQHVNYLEYQKDGLKHMRLKFYIEGSEPGLKGTVHSESKENAETGKYEFCFIFVDIDTYPRRSIIVEDNR